MPAGATLPFFRTILSQHLDSPLHLFHVLCLVKIKRSGTYDSILLQQHFVLYFAALSVLHLLLTVKQVIFTPIGHNKRPRI